jgi:thioredoxin-dependent peroxiredoxin
MKMLILLGMILSLLTIIWMRASHAAEVPSVGQPAPDFALTDQFGKVQKLSDFHGKWLVLYFYPKDDTPHCTTEACQFRDDIFKIRALGAEVVGVSVDDQDSHAEFAAKHGLPFPLLADKGGLVADRYGSITDLLVIKFAKRNTFIIDPLGKIAKSYVSVDAARNPAQVVVDLAALQAVQR